MRHASDAVQTLALAGPIGFALALALAGGASAQTPRVPPRIAASDVEAHREVIGADPRHIGTVDRVEPGSILLTKDDPASRGRYRRIPFGWVDALVEGRRPLKKSSGEATAASD